MTQTELEILRLRAEKNALVLMLAVMTDERDVLRQRLEALNERYAKTADRVELLH